MCQRLFPGRPLADATREGGNRYGVPSVFILLHKNGVAETNIRQSIPSQVNSIWHYIGVLQKSVAPETLPAKAAKAKKAQYLGFRG